MLNDTLISHVSYNYTDYKTMNKNHYVYWLLILTLFAAFSCKSPRKRIIEPNILFISIDDLRPTLSAYGNTIAVTPNTY